MKLIAHRGYWERKYQQNSFEAIFLGLVYADGVEIDLRMHNQEIIVSHDHLKKNEIALKLSDVLPLSKHFPGKLWALNIKEDGLVIELKKLLKKYKNLDYFCFDMSFPETIIYIKCKIKIASRLSDLEPEYDFVSKNAFCKLIDGFKKYPKLQKKFHQKIMIISPELHGRKSLELDNLNLQNFDNRMYLCTDLIGN